MGFGVLYESSLFVRCPYCKDDKDRVVDSRSSEGGRIVRRRRQCLSCRRRFTTYERIEEGLRIAIVKKDGSRVPYDRGRIIAGVQKACYKRPISVQQMETLAEQVEEEVFRQPGQEVSSRQIGELVMASLRQLDQIAYVRYASVYREFQDLGQFIDEVQGVMDHGNDQSGQQQLFNQ